MSLALELVGNVKPARKKKEEEPALVIDGDELLKVGGTAEKEMRVAEAAAEFAELDRQIKHCETQKKGIGDALKALGVRMLKAAEAEGRYYTKALAGMTQICRQNKYSALSGEQMGVLVEALGAVEYATLFDEKAHIEFDSINEMRQFVTMCASLGIRAPGKCVESIVPRSTFNKTKCQLSRVLPDDKRALLSCIGDNTTYAISLKKEEA